MTDDLLSDIFAAVTLGLFVLLIALPLKLLHWIAFNLGD